MFNKSTSPQETRDHTTALRALAHTLEKQIRTWWDISTIEIYLREDIISRGLRWDIAPQDGLEDPTSQNEWLEFFNKCGRELQALILKRKRRKMALIEEKIKALQVELEPVMNDQSTKDFNDTLKKKLEKIDRDTQKKKLKKFNRDMGDFTKNSIYAWQEGPTDMEQEAPDSTQEESRKTPKRPTVKPLKAQNAQKTVPHNTPNNTPRNQKQKTGVNTSNGTYTNPRDYYVANDQHIPQSGEWRKITTRGRGRGRPYQQPSYTQPPVHTYNYYQPLEYNPPNSPRGNRFLGRGRGRGRNRPPFNRHQGDREYYMETNIPEEGAEEEGGSKGKKRRRD